MIPRINLPGWTGGEELSAFARGAKERALRLVVDAASIGDSEEAETLWYLSRLTSELEVLSSVEREGADFLSLGPEQRHADVLNYDVHRQAGSVTYGIIPLHQYHDFAAQFSTETGRDTGELLNKLLLAGVVRCMPCDALVTRDPVLLEVSSLANGNTITVAEALALCGLFLRTRSTFTTARLRVSEEMAFILTVENALPSVLTLRPAAHGGADQFVRLETSIEARLRRLLRARDRVQQSQQIVLNACFCTGNRTLP